MKSKYLAIVLVVLMVIGLVACGQQAQVPEEPSQEVQQTEPAVQPMEVDVTATPIETEPQETPKPVESKEPVEVAENGLEEVVESESVEATPEPTPIPTEAPKQEPVVTKAPESALVQTTVPAQQSDEGQQLEDGTSDDLTQPGKVGVDGVDNWDSEVYNYLDAEQKVIYENASASSRSSFNAKVRQRQQHEAEGWIVDGRDPTGEQYAEIWSHISVGQ